MLLTTATAVSASTVTVEYNNIENIVNNQYSNGGVIILRENFTKNLAGDFTAAASKNNVTNSISGRGELGLTFSKNIFGINSYLRSAVGERYISGKEETSYYSFEPGVLVPINDKFQARLGYRFRDSFDSGVADQTRSIRAGVSYKVNNSYTVGLRLDRVRGDQEVNTWALNVTKRF